MANTKNTKHTRVVALAMDLFVRGGKDLNDALDCLGSEGSLGTTAKNSVRQRAIACLDAASVFYEEADAWTAEQEGN